MPIHKGHDVSAIRAFNFQLSRLNVAFVKFIQLLTDATRTKCRTERSNDAATAHCSWYHKNETPLSYEQQGFRPGTNKSFLRLKMFLTHQTLLHISYCLHR